MRAEWQTKTLGEVLTLEYGKPLPKEDRGDNGLYSAYGANGIKCRTNQYFYDKPSIIVGRKGSAGEVTLTEDKFWPLDVTFYATFDQEKYDLKFLYLALKSLNLQQYAKGVKPGINRNDVYQIEFAFPPLEEQKQIIALLDEAFEGIAIAEANVEKNLANARELFESTVNRTFFDHGESWDADRLGNVCENLDSQRVPITKSKRKKGDIPYYGASDVVDYVQDYLFNEDLLLVSEDGANLLARTYPIAFSISGKTWVNNHAHVLRFKNIYAQKFIQYYLNSISLEPYVSGMAQPKLNQKSLNSIQVPQPAIGKQKEAVEIIDAVYAQVQRLQDIYKLKLKNLTDLKQSLLEKAFSGELMAEKADFEKVAAE